MKVYNVKRGSKVRKSPINLFSDINELRESKKCL